MCINLICSEEASGRRKSNKGGRGLKGHWRGQRSGFKYRLTTVGKVTKSKSGSERAAGRRGRHREEEEETREKGRRDKRRWEEQAERLREAAGSERVQDLLEDVSSSEEPESLQVGRGRQTVAAGKQKAPRLSSPLAMRVRRVFGQAAI